MFYSVDGRIVQIDGRFPIFQDNTLSFRVDGDRFPKTQTTGGSSFVFEFSEQVELEVNWGDGVVETININEGISLFHIFQDGFTGFRTITFKISNPLALVRIGTIRSYMGLNFPSNIIRFKNIEELNFNQNTGIENFPENISSLTKLKVFILNSGSLSQIPLSILNLPLETFAIRSSVDLSRPFSETNLDKINLLQNTLKNLNLSRNGITELPEILGELILLEFLDLQGTPISSFPASLPNLINLNRLRIDGHQIQILPPEVYNLPKIKTIIWTVSSTSNSLQSFQNIDLLPKTIETLIFESNFAGQVFDCTIPDMSAQVNLKYFRADGKTTNFQIEVDKIVNGWYNIVNQNASKTLGNTKFRQMTFLIASQDGTTSPTGTYQQPPEFVLGINNGKPASPKEEIWVMVNQYEHTWNYTE